MISHNTQSFSEKTRRNGCRLNAVVFHRLLRIAAIFVFACSALWLRAAANGSITGTIKDPSGAVVPDAAITVINTALKSDYKAITNGEGFYSFPTLPVGHYDLTIEATGFRTQMKTNISVDTDAALRVDAVLALSQRSDLVIVEAAASAATEAQVDTAATHLGELVTASQMTALPLNGRSYTDLLPIQPGVTPVSTLLPNSVIMAGVTGGLSPSGDLNPGDLSIDGQRESSNGFFVDGIDVQEHMNGGTSVIANLDSIDEFLVLTNNFDPEYGNYNGGMVTVITKSGSDSFHGDVFEFVRNTALDARGYFDPSRPVFRQNQFGGTLGGPVIHQKIFFFGDYQGTRTNQGIETGNISVPSIQDRSGNLSDVADSLTGKVSGSNIASLLSAKLGYGVSAGEPYSQVFPNAVIPTTAWSAPALALLQYIPSPNIGTDQFSTWPNPKLCATTKPPRGSTPTADMVGSPRIISSTITTSTIPIRRSRVERPCRVLTRAPSVARSSSVWEMPRLLEPERSTNSTWATSATPT